MHLKTRRAVFDLIRNKETEKKEGNEVKDEKKYQNLRKTFNRTQRKLQRNLSNLKRQTLKRIFFNQIKQQEEWDQKQRLTNFYMTKIY